MSGNYSENWKVSNNSKDILKKLNESRSQHFETYIGNQELVVFGE